MKNLVAFPTPANPHHGPARTALSVARVPASPSPTLPLTTLLAPLVTKTRVAETAAHPLQVYIYIYIYTHTVSISLHPKLMVCSDFSVVRTIDKEAAPEGPRLFELPVVCARACEFTCVRVSNADHMMQLAFMIMYLSQPLIIVSFASLSVKSESVPVRTCLPSGLPPADRLGKAQPLPAPQGRVSYLSNSSQSLAHPLTHRASLSPSLRLTSRRAMSTHPLPPSTQICPPPCRVCARVC